MFVKSKMSIPVKYYKGSDCIVLKPNTVTFVEDTKVTAKELKDCYGERIDIVTNGTNISSVPEKGDVKLEERKEDVTLASIHNILMEIEGSLKTKAVEVKKEEDEFPEISNTGDEEIDNFLNGESDELPEGTKIISNEEADKLQEKEVKTNKSKAGNKKSGKR